MYCMDIKKTSLSLHKNIVACCCFWTLSYFKGWVTEKGGLRKRSSIWQFIAQIIATAGAVPSQRKELHPDFLLQWNGPIYLDHLFLHPLDHYQVDGCEMGQSGPDSAPMRGCWSCSSSLTHWATVPVPKMHSFIMEPPVDQETVHLPSWDSACLSLYLCIQDFWISQMSFFFPPFLFQTAVLYKPV